jgi:hypothetical protein
MQRLWERLLGASILLSRPAVSSDSHLYQSINLRKCSRCLADNQLVDKFYEAAIEAGGKDNGAPGPRPQYHPGYYGAFVRDPVCSLKIEVVNHNMGSYQ